ncbi:protein of unknown function [Alcaligenes faecalis subsp. faecalis]|nr:protein of unknown function [Alcaligenes faecalis subsp. faecalis]
MIIIFLFLDIKNVSNDTIHENSQQEIDPFISSLLLIQKYKGKGYAQEPTNYRHRNRAAGRAVSDFQN